MRSWSCTNRSATACCKSPTVEGLMNLIRLLAVAVLAGHVTWDEEPAVFFAALASFIAPPPPDPPPTSAIPATARPANTTNASASTAPVRERRGARLVIPGAHCGRRSGGVAENGAVTGCVSCSPRWSASSSSSTNASAESGRRAGSADSPLMITAKAALGASGQRSARVTRSGACPAPTSIRRRSVGKRSMRCGNSMPGYGSCGGASAKRLNAPRAAVLLHRWRC